jgi:hypothetical protein
VDKDIQIYIRQRLSEDKRLRDWHKDLKHEIETILIAGAHGMYRHLHLGLKFCR